MTTQQILARLSWATIGAELDREGYAVLAALLNEEQVSQLSGPSASPHSLATMLRAGFYQHLLPVANRWAEWLGQEQRYPATLDAFLTTRPELPASDGSRVTRLRSGEYEALHQWTNGAWVFPLQLAAVLNEPGDDFTGGAFLMTEQRPRMQSRPIVVPLRKGDIAIVATGTRPHAGARGHYRVNLKHGVGRVRSGQRIGWELLLHDEPR